MSEILIQPASGLKFIPGYIYGLRYPSFEFSVKIVGLNLEERIEKFNTELSNFFLGLAKKNVNFGNSPEKHVLEIFLHWIYVLGRKSELPIFQSGVIKQISINKYNVYIPCSNMNTHKAVLSQIEWLLDYLNSKKNIESFKQLDQSIQALFTGGGTNIPRFYKAAYDLGIPFIEIVDKIQQYGYGSRLRIMNSSFTDRTTQIGATLSRNKQLCSAILAQAGIPVPANLSVYSEEEALKAAHKLGYPVVVKPSDLDGGLGVFAGLSSPQDVIDAYTQSKKFSKNILIEKHINGKDYRINVFNKKVLWAIERKPAGVTGNGKGSIEELLDEINQDPKRGNEGGFSPLKQLVLDHEAIGLLKQYGCTQQSILKEGEFIPLRRKANINSGGTPVEVMDKIHPDNRLLAIRTAEILNLDLAGIDLIIEDISRSWKECDGMICEVNGQPQLGGITSLHVYGEVLQSMIQGNGRIPIIVVFGDADNKISEAICDKLKDNGLKTGHIHNKGVSIGAQCIVEHNRGIYKDGKILLMDRNVDAIVACVNNDAVLSTGLPFDRFDILVLAGSSFKTAGLISKNGIDVLLNKTINVLLHNCAKKVIYSAESVVNIKSNLDEKYSVEVLKEDITNEVINTLMS